MADIDDRGQIILIAAFAIAVTFVSLALVVNSAIFTENLASRGETAGSDDALVVRHEVDQSVGGAIAYANTYNTSSDATLEANVTDSVATIGGSLANQQAATGKIVAVDGPTAFEHGTRIRDNASGGSDFRNASGGATIQQDWRVASDVDGLRALRMNISSASGFQVDLSETAGSDNWRVVVTQSAGEFVVTVHEPGAPAADCTTTGSPDYVTIDVTRGLVAGEPCPPLQFASGIDGQYDVLYNDSDDVIGNYTMVVDGTPASANLDSSTSASPDPYETDALYSANVTYRYDGPAIVYNTTVRVAPGEP